jgi:hypothetical protein
VERACFDPAYGGAGILIFRLPLFLILTLFFFACSTPSNTLPYLLSISEEGLGAIHPETPFDQVNTKLSGFTFEKLSQISPDHPETIFQMKRGENVIAQIISDPSGKKIASIVIISPLVKNRQNQGLGDPLPVDKTLHCDDNLCSKTDEPSLFYRIDPNDRIIREITFSRL